MGPRGRRGRAGPGRRPGGRAPPRQDRANRRPDDRSRPARAPRRGRRADRAPRAPDRDGAARHRAASSAAGSARGTSEAGADDGRHRPATSDAGERLDDAVDILVRHRRRHERERPGDEVRPEVVEGHGRGPPRRPGCGRRRGARRGRRRAAARAGRARPPPRSRAAGRRAGRTRSRRPRARRASHRRSRRWPPGGARAARCGSDRAAGRSTSIPSRSQPRSAAGSDLGQRHAHPPRAPADDRQPVTARAGHRQVAALDDGRLLAGDLRDRVAEPVDVVEIDVGHDRHAAVPGMGRVEPAAQPDLDQRDVRTDLGEAREDDRGQQLELGRVAVASGDPVCDGQDSPTSRAKSSGRDRPAIDLDPLAIRDQVRLRGRPDPMAGRPERRLGQRQDAALAVRPGDERAADRSFRVVELAQQGARPAEPQPDAEPAALGQRAQRLLVGETGGRLGHRGPVTRGSARPRRRRTG